MNTTSPHTRRTFIQSTAIGTAATAAAPLLSAQGTSTAQTHRLIETDVLVCGGGCAGIAAALASARDGAKTLLIERAGFSGGIITTVGLPYFDGLIDKPSGRFVVKGIALELLQRLGIAKLGAKSIDDLPQELVTKYWGSVRIPNVEHFKVLTDELIRQRRQRPPRGIHSAIQGRSGFKPAARSSPAEARGRSIRSPPSSARRRGSVPAKPLPPGCRGGGVAARAGRNRRRR